VSPASPGTFARRRGTNGRSSSTGYRAFAIEAVGEDPGDERLARSVDHNLSAVGAGFALRDDGGPVSFAGYGNETRHGVRIGPVYTPPEHRSRGYASAVVAGLSQQLLDEGRRFCFLFTDLANPTANRLYARLGYKPVCDAAEIVFDTP
jgi:predicted GNAT family acetyltransferase